MAEIQKKIKICPNGHPYDPSRFESCPICSNGGFAPTLDPFAPDSMSATVDPGQQNMGSFAQTAPPDSGYQNQHYMPESYSQFTPTAVPEVRYSGRMQETQSVDPSTPAGTSSPVVGWLVALDGPCRGTDYRIRVGYTTMLEEPAGISAFMVMQQFQLNGIAALPMFLRHEDFTSHTSWEKIRCCSTENQLFGRQN